MKEKTEKNKGISLVVVLMLVVLLIVIVCGAVYYFMIYSNTEQIYKRLIDSSMNAYQESAQKEEYKTINAKIGANVNVELEESDEQTEKIVDLINALDIALNVQMDREDKKMALKLESDYKNDDLLNADIYADVEKEKMYVTVEKILDKYIEMDMDDETSKSLKQIFETTNTNQNEASLKKAIGIIKEELKKVIKPEYCSKQKEEITINNKKINATKNIITMTSEQLSDEFITLLTNLKNNQEFLDCYKNSDDIVEAFEDLIEQLEDAKNSNDDVNFKISLYTTGITHKVVKVDSEAIQDDEVIKVEIVNIDENNCEISVSYEGESIKANIIKANIKNISETESECTVKINIPETGKIALNLNVSCTLNEEMEEFDHRNTMRIEDMTEDDTNDIIERFSKTKLYELINEFSGGMLNGSNGIMQRYSEAKDNIDEAQQREKEMLEEFENLSENLYNEDNYETEDENDNYFDDFMTDDEEQMSF